MKRSSYSKEQLKKWEEYDQTFTDPMDNETVEGFKDVDKDDLPDSWGVVRFNGEVFERVGNGEVTDPSTCGKFKKTDSGKEKILGCLNVELHAHVSLDGVNHAGKVALKKVFMSCDKPSCPTCFKRGWANREATNATEILKLASKGYTDKNGQKHMGRGKEEHIVSSVPKTDYGLSFEKLKAKNQKVLRRRGIIGGVTIFHLQRYRGVKEAGKMGLPVEWYVAPHFHTVGFIEGGYGRCRGCPNAYKGFFGEMHVKETVKCLACEGFEGLTRRCYAKEGGGVGAGNSGSGWIVKVMGERKSIHATLWYQLNHATFQRGSKRAHVASWFGVCSYTKLKLTKEDKVHKAKCSICLSDMEEVVRVGGEDVEWWVREWEESFLGKDGVPNWTKAPEINRGFKRYKA